VVEFVADLAEVGYALEAEGFVEVDRDCVFSVYSADHGVFAEALGDGDEGEDEVFADAFAAVGVVDVDGVFDGEAVAGPGAEVAEGGVAGDLFFDFGYEDGVAGAGASVEPGEAIVEGDGLVVIDGGGGGDDLVVDVEDGWDVGFDGWADEHAGSPEGLIDLLKIG
jgi:hypothetical protein